jgi:hypothetical protein
LTAGILFRCSVEPRTTQTEGVRIATEGGNGKL